MKTPKTLRYARNFLYFNLITLSLFLVGCATFRALFDPSPTNPVGKDLQDLGNHLGEPWRTICYLGSYALLREATPHAPKAIKHAKRLISKVRGQSLTSTVNPDPMHGNVPQSEVKNI